MNHRIGILGGYGRTGRIVVQELAKLPNVDVTLGGRDLGKANAVLSSSGFSSARAVVADALDPESLKRFCSDRDVVINCTGPTCRVLDRVAWAALQSGAHYIDPGGYDTVYRSMKDRNGGGPAQNRVCLISAGLCPGITELLVQHMADWFDQPASLDFYMDGRCDMSLGVFEDMIHTFFPIEVGTFEHGVFTPRSKWASKSYQFPKPIGKQRAVPLAWPEIQRFATERHLPHVGWHVAANLQFLTLKDLIHPLFKNLTKAGGRLLKIFYDLEISKYGDMYVFAVESEGRKNGEMRHAKATMVVRGEELYRLTAVALVVAAQTILGGEAVPGIHYLADGVKPASFIERLRPYGVTFHLEEKKL
jgi:saccharopine dehydrogenase (NAD+, L-lysine forming)